LRELRGGDRGRRDVGSDASFLGRVTMIARHVGDLEDHLHQQQAAHQRHLEDLRMCHFYRPAYRACVAETAICIVCIIARGLPKIVQVFYPAAIAICPIAITNAGAGCSGASQRGAIRFRP
jgi:hypothetical protein